MRWAGMNKELWNSAIDEQAPCGDDLEYDVEFLALGQVAQGKAEQQYGDTVIPAEEPDWREVERLGETLLKRTKDIRVCLLLIRAYVRNAGLVGLAEGLQALQALLERYWEQVHPLLVIDGDFDPFVRANALAGLADLSGLMRDIRFAVLTKSAIGTVLVKDAEAALDSAQRDDLPYGREQLAAIYADTAQQASMLALLSAHDAFKAIAKLCDERLGSEYAPDLSLLSLLLSSIARSVQSSSGTAESEDAPGETLAGDDGSVAANLPKSGNGIGEIRSREDAIRVLETVCKYIEKNEPTNPAPLLIKRAQRLMSLGFLDIIRELAPDGMGQIEVITGIRRD
jgi:type VI secretion system protein ImpA